MIFETEFITPGGLVLECHTLMESREPETLSEPMEPPVAELQSALVGGIDNWVVKGQQSVWVLTDKGGTEYKSGQILIT